MRPRPPDLPDYRDPPVNEVVVGVQFVRLPITGAHVGRFWGLVADRYPRIEEHPPLEPQIETLTPKLGIAHLQFSMEPPYTRHWLISRDDAELLQLQPDRFLFNWRARPGAGEYPHFEAIHQKFETAFGEWREFVRPHVVQITHWEVTYVNRIAAGEQSQDLGDVLSFIGPRLRHAIGGPPEAARFDAQRILLLDDGTRWARAYISAKNGFGPKREPLVLLELTVRGPLSSPDDATVYGRHFQARKWIVQAFDVLTTEAQHRIWGKK
jgi:uncharacterized protein (TIGR04255 family)